MLSHASEVPDWAKGRERRVRIAPPRPVRQPKPPRPERELKPRWAKPKPPRPDRAPKSPRPDPKKGGRPGKNPGPSVLAGRVLAGAHHVDIAREYGVSVKTAENWMYALPGLLPGGQAEAVRVARRRMTGRGLSPGPVALRDAVRAGLSNRAIGERYGAGERTAEGWLRDTMRALPPQSRPVFARELARRRAKNISLARRPA